MFRSGLLKARGNMITGFAKGEAARGITFCSPCFGTFTANNTWMGNNNLQKLRGDGQKLPKFIGREFSSMIKSDMPGRRTLFSPVIMASDLLHNKTMIRNFSSSKIGFHGQDSQGVDVEYEGYDLDDLIIDIDSMETFQKTVQQNRGIPLIIECYADWCNTCKQVSGILSKLITEFGGQIKILKLNVEKVPDVTQAIESNFPISHLPTLIGIIRGSHIAGQIVGLQVEQQYHQFFSQLIQHQYEGLTEEQKREMIEESQRMSSGKKKKKSDEVMSPQERLLAAKQELARGKHMNASEHYNAIIGDPDAEKFYPKAYAGLVMCCLGGSEFDKAKLLTEKLKELFPDDVQSDEDVKRSIALYSITSKYNNLEGNTSQEVIQNLEKKLSLDPNDHQARLEYSIALFTMTEHEKSLDECLYIIKKDKKWNEGAARRQLLEYFDALGNISLTHRARKKLSSLLF